MSTSPTPVDFTLRLPTGAPVAGGKATFTLSGFGLDGGIVMPTPVEVDVQLDGTGSVNLWPNVAGLRATSYKVSIVPNSGPKLETSNVVVPESDVPVDLHHLVPVGTIAGLTAVVMTQAAYDELEVKEAQTLYLIRAEA